MNDIDVNEQRAIWNSMKNNTSNVREFDVQDYRNKKRNEFHSPQLNAQASSSFLKRGIKVGLGLAAVGLAGYAIYTNAGLLQRHVSGFQFDFSKLMSHMDKLDSIKATNSQFSLKKYLKPAAMIGGVLLLLKLNLHKHIASTIKSIIKFVFNHKKILLAAVLMTAVILYTPQSKMSIYATQALAFLGNAIIQAINELKTGAPLLANVIEFLSKNAKIIGFLVFDFAVLGFIHQAYDYCSGKQNRFTGGSYRLGNY